VPRPIAKRATNTRVWIADLSSALSVGLHSIRSRIGVTSPSPRTFTNFLGAPSPLAARRPCCDRTGHSSAVGAPAKPAKVNQIEWRIVMVDTPDSATKPGDHNGLRETRRGSSTSPAGWTGSGPARPLAQSSLTDQYLCRTCTQPSTFLACSPNWRMGPTGPISIKTTPSSVSAVCPAGQ